MNEFRRLMMNSVEKTGNQPIFLSGGIDSATILAASLALGWKPLCITFYLGSQSLDFLMSQSMAENFSCEFIPVKIIPTIENLKKDVNKIIEMGTTRKTFIQCMQPFLYMVPELAKRGYHHAYWGMASGDLVGDSREAHFAHHRSVKEWNEKRRFAADIYHKNKLNTSDGWINDRLEKYYHFTAIDPYWNHDLREYILSKTFEELHRPKNKWLYVEAFPEFWGKNEFWYRRHSNLQINSGIREWHDKLLDLPEYKMLQSKSVKKIYNYIGNKSETLEEYFE